jgi:ubiquinone biosynthesis protein
VKKYLRLLQILKIAAKYRLQELLEDFNLGTPVSLLFKLPFSSDKKLAKLTRGMRLRLALEELGPIFIKFGQLLSTRRDMLPLDIADELAKLQDQVAPFNGVEAQKIIEQALGDKVTHIFKDFSSAPLASASIAQVHTAKLLSGEEVVIKVVRPGIENIIAQDLALLKLIASFIEKYTKDGKRLRAKEIIKDYDFVIHDELNLQAEGANGTQLRKNFENNNILYVPKIYWDCTRNNILVMERIHGIPISHIDELKKANIDLKKLAETGVEIFFTQVFDHSFFHADMHPGNIFVSREHTDKPQYIALDCAIFGSLSEDDQQYLAKNLLAIFKRDYRKVAELHVECGWVPPDTPVHAFEATMRSVCEPIFEKPLSDISFGALLLELFRTAGRFNMELQPSLVLLQKTLLNVEGLGKELYPDLDLWQTALPFLENWQKKRMSPWENLKKLKGKVPDLLEQLPELPELVYDFLSETRTSRRQTQRLLKEQAKAHLQAQQKQSEKRFHFGLAALLLASLMIFTDLGQFMDSMPLELWLLGFTGIGLLYFRR